jgi:glutamyl-tRNA synthetase
LSNNLNFFTFAQAFLKSFSQAWIFISFKTLLKRSSRADCCHLSELLFVKNQTLLSMSDIRVRFAPSPTGALHIGGVRTALYNYLFARKHQGSFILRIEDTDQLRYIPGAEDYILEALEWCGLQPDESPQKGGPHGPYRQSERKEIYQKYARQLLESGHAYMAFDSPEELDAKRQEEKEKGNHNFKYDQKARLEMKNSLTLSDSEVNQLLENNTPYTIRLKVPENQSVHIQDLIRDEVVFQTEELDDKVILKADGMPTYHLANVVDDHLMEISHVIRGEEWLSSTAHHILLYRAFGWEDNMPAFAHLPLILKPTGKGKLSKRDGAKLGIPVFPLRWEGDTPEDSFTGFREFGFDPKAVLNFLAFLGWNPGTEQEIFSLTELEDAFSVDKIGKSGARFDFDKAKWYNQQYIIATPDLELAHSIRPYIEAQGHQASDEYLQSFCHLLKERVTFFTDFWEAGYYFFEDVREYDQKVISKKWKAERLPLFEDLTGRLAAQNPFQADTLEPLVKGFISEKELKFGDVLPILRVALSGTTKGPDLFGMMALLGKEKVTLRLKKGLQAFQEMI